MVVMRESWTDERLDEFGKRMDERFDHADRRLDRIEIELPRIHDRIDSVQRTMAQGLIALASIQITGFVGLAGLFLAQG
jgi:hypothetical protein